MHFTDISAYYPPLMFLKAWNSPFPHRKYFTGYEQQLIQKRKQVSISKKEICKI